MRASQVAGADRPGSTTVTGPVLTKFPKESIASPTSSSQSGPGSHLSLPGRFLNGVWSQYFIRQHCRGSPHFVFSVHSSSLMLWLYFFYYYSFSRPSFNDSCSRKSFLSPHMPWVPWVRALHHTDFGRAGSRIASPPSSAGSLSTRIVFVLIRFLSIFKHSSPG